jgi:DNA polymerase-1
MNSSTLPFFQAAFEDPEKSWVMANAKYDTHILANVGVNIAGELRDTQVMHALLYEDRPHGLKHMAQHILGWKWSDFQDTFGKISKARGVTAEDVIRRAEAENFNLLVEYAANDAWGTWNVYKKLEQQLTEAVTHSLYTDTWPHINTLWDLFSKIEVPYTKVLWKNERAGIKLDVAYLEKCAPEIKKGIHKLGREITREAGFNINPESPQQLRELFFDKMGINPLKQTKGGKTGVRHPSTDKGVLVKLAESHPIAEKILEYRKLSKLYGTYILGLAAAADPNGRIHARFNQDVTRTGRLSSSNPNMQNIPRPDNDAWGLRKAFIPEEGNCIIAGDYKQLEMRLLACAALEQDMIDIFARDWDIHMGNASLMFDIPYEEIEDAKQIEKQVKTGELEEDAMTPHVTECLQARAAAKAIGFGLNYGMGAKKLAGTLKCSMGEAQQKIKTYRGTYPAVDNFYKEAIEETEKYGYAFTLLGRRRNVPEILSTRKDERHRAERIAVNTQIQGSAADVVKMAQIVCDSAELEERYGCHMLLQIHDELVFECPIETAQEAMEEVRLLMENSLPEPLPVALGVDIGMGNSWMAAK